MNLHKTFSNLCNPAKFYLVLAIISAVYYSYMLLTHSKASEHPDNKEVIDNHTMNGLLVQIAVSVLWVFVLSWVCKMKHGVKIAWFLVFLPVLFVILMMFFALHMINNLNPEDIDKLVDSVQEDTEDRRLPDIGVEGFCDECN